ncbi:MAG: glycoside hydrolase family 5 protein, partial [Caldilineae bacterium]
MRQYPLLLSLLVSGLLAGCAQAGWQQPAWITALQTPQAISGPVDQRDRAFDMNRRLGRGINMGNALEAPYEGAWGMYARDEYFAVIAEAGFSHVRLPVRWNAHAKAAPPYTIDERFFERVDRAVQAGLDSGLLVVLDFHHYTGMMVDPQSNRERFLALWRQVAEHYAGYPDELLFELLNEPNDKLTASIWNDILVEALNVVRESNPTRIVVVGPERWYNVRALPTLRLPEDDPYLIASFHYYEPFHFTHQGADWVNGSAAWLGTEWTGSADQRWNVEADLKSAARWGEQN